MSGASADLIYIAPPILPGVPPSFCAVTQPGSGCGEGLSAARAELWQARVGPRATDVDGHPAYTSAISELKQLGEPCLNNLIEHGHRPVKKRVVASQGFRSAEGAFSAAAGYDAMHIVRQRLDSLIAGNDVVGPKRFIEHLSGMAAVGSKYWYAPVTPSLRPPACDTTGQSTASSG